jgi:HisA/HisF family protein
MFIDERLLVGGGRQDKARLSNRVVRSSIGRFTMRVIPVIDLMHGQVVRGVAGRRSEYRPVESRIAPDARPESVARAIVVRFGFHEAYVADLGAILGGPLDVSGWNGIADSGLRLMLDAGVGSVAAAKTVTDALDRSGIDADIVVGLESLQSTESLARIVESCRARAVIFSLDMKNGRLLTREPALGNMSPLEVAQYAISASVRRLIVLDLADVGTGSGTRTLDVCRQIRALPALDSLVAGGGVRGIDDLHALAEAGCDAALVASALHDGRLTPEQVREIENWAG